MSKSWKTAGMVKIDKNFPAKHISRMKNSQDDHFIKKYIAWNIEIVDKNFVIIGAVSRTFLTRVSTNKNYIGVGF